MPAAAPARKVVIRSPKRADYDRIAELSGQLGYPSTADQIEARLRGMRGQRDFAVFLAELDGEVAGWLGAYLFRAVEIDPTVKISGLVVGAGARSRGVGKLLLDAAEAWARHLGCTAISVNCNVKRRRAHGFYSRNGYGWIKSQKVLRKQL